MIPSRRASAIYDPDHLYNPHGCYASRVPFGAARQLSYVMHFEGKLGKVQGTFEPYWTQRQSDRFIPASARDRRLKLAPKAKKKKAPCRQPVAAKPAKPKPPKKGDYTNWEDFDAACLKYHNLVSPNTPFIRAARITVKPQPVKAPQAPYRNPRFDPVEPILPDPNYVYQPFPRWKYFLDGSAVLVNNIPEARKLGLGWYNTPQKAARMAMVFGFVPPPPPNLPDHIRRYYQKLYAAGNHQKALENFARLGIRIPLS